MDRNEKSLQDCVGPGTSGLVTPYMTTQANGLTNRSAIPSGSSPMSTIDLFNGCLCRAMSGDIGTDTPLKNPFRSEACPLTEDDLLRQSCSDDPYDPRGGIRPECKKLLEEDNKKLVDEYEQWAAKKRCEIAASGAGTTGTYVALATTIDGVTCGEVPAPVVHRSFVSAGCRAIDCAEGECVCSGPNPTDCGCGGVMDRLLVTTARQARAHSRAFSSTDQLTQSTKSPLQKDGTEECSRWKGWEQTPDRGVAYSSK